jgi:hypothetical protein
VRLHFSKIVRGRQRSSAAFSFVLRGALFPGFVKRMT